MMVFETKSIVMSTPSLITRFCEKYGLAYDDALILRVIEDIFNIGKYGLYDIENGLSSEQLLLHVNGYNLEKNLTELTYELLSMMSALIPQFISYLVKNDIVSGTIYVISVSSYKIKIAVNYF